MSQHWTSGAQAALPYQRSPALAPLRRATAAIECGELEVAQQQIDLVAQQLAARAAWLEDDLRRRHEALSSRFAEHARRLRERLAQHPARPALAPSQSRNLDHPPADAMPPGDTLATMVCEDRLRQLLISRFVMPLRHPEQAARYRQASGGGLLLFGPPGTGKTHLVRALARELAVPVFDVSPSDLLSKWLGESEKHLAELFAQARKSPAALVFIDEIDVLAPHRDAAPDAGGPMQRLMAQLLAELDGFRQAPGQLLFVGATNRPWALDEALLRPGRFDTLAWVGLPDAAMRAALLRQALQGVPTEPALSWSRAARALADRSIAQTIGCARVAARQAFERTVRTGIDHRVRLDDLLYAAGLSASHAEVVDLSTFRAFAQRHAVPRVELPMEADGSPDDNGDEKSPQPLAATRLAGGFEPLRFIAARDLQLDLETLPFVSYAIQHAGIGPVRQINLVNQGAEDSQNLLVEVALVPSDLGDTWSTNIATLAAGEAWQSGSLALPLRLERLRSVTEKEQAHLRITVRDRDEVLLARTESLPVLAYNEWVYLPHFLELTAAFVQPNSPALQPVVCAAARRLESATGSAAFAGYQTGGAERVMAMIEALHDSLALDQALNYINPPPSFEQSGQKVRLVADTLTQGRGTCLDLALLQAALWEHVGLHPLLVLVPGHAMLACWMAQAAGGRQAVTMLQPGRGGKAARSLQDALNAGQMCVFNSVEVCGRQDLAAAQRQGLHVLRDVLQRGENAQFIDIVACRPTVTPLP